MTDTTRENAERVAKEVALQWQIHKNPYPVKFDLPIEYDKPLADALEQAAALLLALVEERDELERITTRTYDAILKRARKAEDDAERHKKNSDIYLDRIVKLEADLAALKGHAEAMAKAIETYDLNKMTLYTPANAYRKWKEGK
jgi:hypothetical protein